MSEVAVDLNLVVIAGHLAAEPEWSHKTGQVETLRFLVTVKSELPKHRIDVIPVTLLDPAHDEPLRTAEKGQSIWIAGTLRRTFTLPSVGVKRSNIEVVAHEVSLRANEPDLSLVTDDDKAMS